MAGKQQAPLALSKSASHDAYVATHNEIADLRPYF
jgi:hypothetical protein